NLDSSCFDGNATNVSDHGQRASMSFTTRVFQSEIREPRVTPNLFLASSDQDLHGIYALRYRAYRAIEAIPPNDARAFSDEFDARVNSWSFGIRVGDLTIGSVRLSSSTCGGGDVTAYRAYPEAIDEF